MFIKKNKYIVKRIASLGLALIIVATLVPTAFVQASEEIYVNTSDDMLSGDINSAYAIGGGGTVSQISDGKVYVMTGDGLATIGGAVAPVGDPEHLDVTGTVELPSELLKVGLYYYDSSSSVRNPTLDYANLQNSVGSGYKFGYYNSTRTFVEVGFTEETAITMAMDTSIDLPGGHVGTYHIMLTDTFEDYESAYVFSQQFGDAFPAYISGKYSVMIGSYDKAEEATADAAARGINGSAYTGSDRCISVTRTSDAKILFEFDYGRTYSLAVSPQSESGKAETWFKGYLYHGDFEYQRRTGEKITVINYVEIEDYVKGVLPYEMSASWPLEALKAQALCARTYAAAHFYTYSSYGFDITNDTYSQVYRGTSLANANSDRAVEETSNQYILHNGKLISAMYSSSFGGGSEDVENIFGGAIYDYLRGVIDPYEEAADSINGKSDWEYKFSASQISSSISNFGYSVGTVSEIVPEYSDTGNVIALTFKGSSGTKTIKTNYVYRFSTATLGMPSVHYEISREGDYFVFTGGGYGHNVGMSQFGAHAMANVYGFSYDQIVNFYYTDVTLGYGVF